MSGEITITEIETAEEWVNQLAREAPDGELFPEEYDQEDVVDLCDQVDEKIRNLGRVDMLEEETLLTAREAEVVALKERGVSMAAIALYFDVHGGGDADGEPPTSESEVEEYDERIQEKYHLAEATFGMLRQTYSAMEKRVMSATDPN